MKLIEWYLTSNPSILAIGKRLTNTVGHTAGLILSIEFLQEEEIEMEDVDEPVIDIDSSDLKDPLAVVEYINDMIAYFRKTEVTFICHHILVLIF